MSIFPGETTLLTQSRDPDPVRLQILHQWAAQRHVWINEDVCVDAHIDRPYIATHGKEQQCDRIGFGVFVKREASNVIERQTLMLVPKTAILSPKSSSILPFIEAHQLYSSDATSGLYLSLTLLHEFLIGPSGAWWGYLQSLPQVQCNSGADFRWGVSLPLHWDQDGVNWKWIEGTEAARIVQRANDDPTGHNEGFSMSMPRLRHFFDRTVLPTLRRAHATLFDDCASADTLWADFIGMHSIVSSRAFVVDMFHGQAMVPLADMFNHTEDANVHFEADDEVCDECGALGKCDHSDDPLPFAAYGRPSAFLPAAYGPNSKGWSAPRGLEGLDTIDMVAQETISPGQEALNSYGLMSNAALLTAYGFCLEEETDYDRCVWEWRNAKERDQIRSALGLHRVKKRKLHADGTALAADESTYEKWSQACVTFSKLSEKDFAEIREDPLQVLARKKSTAQSQLPDGLTKLTLPVESPFVSLMRSLSDILPDKLNKARLHLDEAFAGLSGHDGSRDSQQPFFVDATGRISWPLWRATLLSSTSSVDVSGNLDVDKSIAETEQYIAGMGSEGIEDFARPKNETSSVVIQLTSSTLRKLKKLVSERLKSLHITQLADGSEEALRIIEVSIPYLIHDDIVLIHCQTGGHSRPTQKLRFARLSRGQCVKSMH